MSCNTSNLDKRARIFSTRDGLVWMFYVESVNDLTDDGLNFSITKVEGGDYKAETASWGDKTDIDSLLFFDNFLIGSGFSLPTDGNTNGKMLWATYEVDKKLHPIIGAKYHDLYFDGLTQILHVIFQANVHTADLDKLGTDKPKDAKTGKSPGKFTASDLYPDAISDGSDADDNLSKRCIFYCSSTYSTVNLTTQDKTTAIRGFFVFSKPTLILNAGDAPVVDTFDGGSFVELR